MRRLPLALVVLAACTTHVSGPQPIAYDKEACTYCHMLIGDPRYAAQLVTTDDQVLDFDDPGCLQHYVDEHHPSVKQIWYRDAHADRWLAADQVRFEPGADTPMGWGRAATLATRTP
jgi:copper chaperone NosL